MKSIIFKVNMLLFAILLLINTNIKSSVAYEKNQDFQGEAIYISKSKMDLGRFGERMSQAQKKQIQARLKNRLEKTYVLTFNKEESMFIENEKLDAISGATDSWGANFSAGDQYKNVKTNTQIQQQEFYGKKFLVKDKLQSINWKINGETKQIGQYTCFRATASIPSSDLAWYSFSWSSLRNNSTTDTLTTTPVEVKMTNVEAWYTSQIPVSHGPSEYWGLPGLILEINAGSTTMLCSKVVINPTEKIAIKAPKKGTEITKKAYQKTLLKKMKEFRDNRSRRRG